jgi:hypothetical protein
MIEWWWLLIEAGVFIMFAVWNRGVSRTAALADALGDPRGAERELARRWKSDVRSVREVIMMVVHPDQPR